MIVKTNGPSQTHLGTARRPLSSAVTNVLVLLAGLAVVPASGADSDISHRFRFRYEVGIRELREYRTVRVWVPFALEDDHQQLHSVTIRAQRQVRISREPKYGNRILYWTGRTRGGPHPVLSVEYEVTRKEVQALAVGRLATDRLGRASGAADTLRERDRHLFLSQNRMVPVGGPSLALIDPNRVPSSPLKRARYLYDAVLAYLEYKKVGRGWGRGDVYWACDSRYGNCTDFHSVFISLARYFKLPAKFVIGFPLPSNRRPATIAGYHCWAYFYLKRFGWVPVDISEADKHPSLADYYFGTLDANRIAFSVGRDIELVPPSGSGPLNFFIYPHVELDGRPLPKESLWYRFFYEPLAGSTGANP